MAVTAPGTDSARALATHSPGALLAATGHRDELMRQWAARLKSAGPSVALADGEDFRIVSAAAWLAAHTPVRPLLIGDEDVVASVAAHSNVRLKGVAIQSPEALGRRPEVRAALGTRSDGQPRDSEQVRRMAADPVLLSAASVTAGVSDACVAGATRPTGDVIRAALSVIGLAEGEQTLTSSFLMIMPDGRRLAYGDCAVLPKPSPVELAQVARATARTFVQLTGERPLVALLSFSTYGSADHPDVDRVREATRLVRQTEPELMVDGELQFDAAVIESVARAKAEDSGVAGQANVLVFPDLGAGNIGYKITERLAGAAAIGPILQGLAAPMNDLSRGCSAEDAALMALLGAMQSVERA